MLPTKCETHGNTIDESFCCSKCEELAEATLKTHRHLFVYGTLKSGYGNHGLLANAISLGPAVSLGRNFAMESICVSEVKEGGAPVKGELYEVLTDAEWARLDRLENHPRVYRREVRTFVTEAGKHVDAWIYLFKLGSRWGGKIKPRPEHLNAEGQLEWCYY